MVRVRRSIVRRLSVLPSLGIVCFVLRELTAARPFINLRVLGNSSVGAAAAC